MMAANPATQDYGHDSRGPHPAYMSNPPPLGPPNHPSHYIDPHLSDPNTRPGLGRSPDKPGGQSPRYHPYPIRPLPQHPHPHPHPHEHPHEHQHPQHDPHEHSHEHSHEQSPEAGGAGNAGRQLSTSKRAEQNRKAQRAFRERREQHVKQLESRSALLDAALASADAANRRYEEARALVEQLRSENTALRAALQAATNTGGKPINNGTDAGHGLPPSAAVSHCRSSSRNGGSGRASDDERTGP